MPASTGSLPSAATMGMVDVASWRAHASIAAAGDKNIDFAAHEFGDMARDRIPPVFAPSKLDVDVVPIDKSSLTQSLPEHIDEGHVGR